MACALTGHDVFFPSKASGEDRLDSHAERGTARGGAVLAPARTAPPYVVGVASGRGTFYYLCSLLDGASRAVVHWEIREAMTELDVECIMQRAHETFPDAKPRIISDTARSSLPRTSRSSSASRV